MADYSKRNVVEPPATQDELPGVTEEEHLGVPAAVVPLWHTVVTARLSIGEPDALQAAQRRLTAALAEVEHVYPLGPSGIFIQVAYGLSYFRKSDYRDHIDRVLGALFRPGEQELNGLPADAAYVGDLFTITAVRRGFAGHGMPRIIGERMGIPGAENVPPGRDAVHGLHLQPRARTRAGHPGQLRDAAGLDQLRRRRLLRRRYGDAPVPHRDEPRHVVLHGPPGSAAPNVPPPSYGGARGALTGPVPGDLYFRGGPRRGRREAWRARPQRADAVPVPLKEETTTAYGETLPRRTVFFFRQDFDTVENPFLFSATDRINPMPLAAVHFVGFGPSSQHFEKMRLEMDG